VIWGSVIVKKLGRRLFWLCFVECERINRGRWIGRRKRLNLGEILVGNFMRGQVVTDNKWEMRGSISGIVSILECCTRGCLLV